VKSGRGAVLARGIASPARWTTADSAGTVSVSRPSASVRALPVPTGQTPRKALSPELKVSTVTVCSCSELLTATTYSRSSASSIRLKA
jgi:hypothetical protein